ncbi:hypothetical protein SteCoe_23826 [Stentor coeruleus]|uniref:ADP-dependent glucokinase n=1 Tax=Stentor coeruleus TaxID=5963 RepID=A0A1R2BJ13_9CILI|nr:hypothetical protein SteCoe_23826 [Stentor coeruleus]
MKCTWIIISIQFIIISYLFINSQTQTEVPNLNKSLEKLRHSACNSALLSSSCLTFNKPDTRNCNIAFTFAAMIDIRLRFTDFTNLLIPPPEARHHEQVKTKQQMLETMAYSFSTGRAAEYRVTKELFDFIISILQGVENWKTLGGNGAMMSLRAAHEGCGSYLSAPVTEEMTKYFPSNVQFLNEFVDAPDLHIILEYREGERWGKYLAPRSNRFYMNHDTLNINPKFLEGINSTPNVQVIAIGGLQLIENTEVEDDFLTKTHIAILSNKNKKIKTHIEMGDFHSYTYFKKLQPLFKSADSIGMNEQELGILLTHLKKIKFAGYPSKAPIKKYLEDLVDLIDELTDNLYEASRIHLHTINSQIICSNNEWTDPEIATARSAILAGQFACNNTDIQHTSFSFYENDDWYVEDITKCWGHKHMRCCLALVPTCLNVVQVSGLGDNISAMGLVYHPIK